MSTEQSNPVFAICYMPDGRPAPEVMIEKEAISFLRLDTEEGNPSLTIKYYRDKGLLRAVRIGRNMKYTKTELLKFLDRLSGRTNKTEI